MSLALNADNNTLQQKPLQVSNSFRRTTGRIFNSARDLADCETTRESRGSEGTQGEIRVLPGRG